MNYKVIKTGDESTTLYVPELDETYHSTHGAIIESRYVFIRNGLRYWISEYRKKHVSILEIGFGTGLNTLLTIPEAEKFGINIEYISIEPNPLSDRILSEINHADRLGGNRFTSWFKAIHKTEWNSWCEIGKNFRLKKVKASLQDVEFGDDSFDIVFFDPPYKLSQMEKTREMIHSLIIELFNDL